MGRSHHRNGLEDQSRHDAALAELTAALPADILDGLISTGEIRRPDDEAHVQAVLRRFIVADKGDVHRALKRLNAHVTWRAAAIPPGGIPSSSVTAQIAHAKVLLQPAGPDGRPVLVIRVGRHLPTVPEEVERFVVYSLEAAAVLADAPGASPDAKIWALFDLRDVSLANMDRHALAACFRLLNAHFPERVRKIFMLNSPMIFSALWAVVSPFIDPHTKKKVAFVSSTDAVLAEIDAGVLPKAYGGTADEVPVEEAVARLQGENGG